MADPPVGERTVHRIAYLIPVFGGIGSLLAYALMSADWAGGIALGTILAWLNFRWMKRGLEFLTTIGTAQSDEETPPSSGTSAFSALFRYALIGFLVYVIFNYLHVPLASIAVGLCAFAAATIAASVWEILQSIR